MTLYFTKVAAFAGDIDVIGRPKRDVTADIIVIERETLNIGRTVNE